MTLKSLRGLFFSPRGRIGRQPFVMAIVAALMFNILFAVFFKYAGTGIFSFFLGFAYLFLNIQVLYCVYGKRLHDIGRGMWAVTGMLALLFFVMLIVQLKFGGLEYFNTLYDNPEIGEDPIAMQALTKTYQDELSQSVPFAPYLFASVPALFTIWLALTPGHKKDNQYGPQGSY